MVDTGSSTNLIHSDLLKELDVEQKVDRHTNMRLVGVTGTKLKLDGILRKTSMSINNHPTTIDFVISDTINEEAILGQEFLQAYNIVLDFSSKIL